MIPATFTCLDALPLTVNGKLDRRALPEPEWVRESDYIAPRNSLESALCRVWQDVLSIPVVGIEDNFFHLGGNSILVTKLISEMKGRLNLSVPLSLIYQHNHIAGIAAHVRKEEIVTIPRTEMALYPLSHAQERMLFIERFNQGTHAYHIPFLFKACRDLDLPRFIEAFNLLIERHSVLRTVYRIGHDNNYYQHLLTVPLSLRSIGDFSCRNALKQAIEKESSSVFDLGCELPVRVSLFTSQEQSYLLLNFHHIAVDGWSVDLLMNELAILYDALTRGDVPTLPPLTLSYGDYAAWHRTWISAIEREQAEFWRQALADVEPLRLPADNPRPVEFDHQGQDFHIELSAGLSEQLRQLARKEATTLYCVLLTGFYITLNRWTGQSDLVVGTPSDNRHHFQCESIIGLLVNTLVMRGRVDNDVALGTLIRQIHQMVGAARAHQDLPFDRLLDLLQIERDSSRHPLFQIMFSLQNFGEKIANNLPLEPLQGYGVPSPAKFDLSLFLSDCHGCIRGNFNYATSLFESESIERVAGMFQQVLMAMVQCTDERIKDIDVMSDVERKRLAEWSGTGSAFPLDKTLHQCFEEQVAKTPRKTALICGNESLTYAELDSRATLLAHHIRDRFQHHYRHTMQPDTLIGLYLDRGLDMVISILAVLKAGAAYVPISPDFPDARTKYILDDTQASLVLTHAHYQKRLGELASSLCEDTCLLADRFKAPAAPAGPPSIAALPSSLAYVIYTSGTTGTPKGVAMEHRAAVCRSHAMSMASQTAGNTYLFKTNYIFDVSVSDLFSHLMTGAKIVITRSSFDIDEIRTLQELYRINACHLVPSQLPLLCDAGALGNDIRQLYFSGENLTDNHLGAIDLQRTAVLNYYGPTETGETTFHRPHRENEGSIIGRPLPGTRAYVLQSGRLAPIGTPGELFISGPGLARGYLNNPALTDEKFVANPFESDSGDPAYSRMYKTGDLVRWLPDGTLKYLGRNDSQVKIRGYRIELTEVEKVLLTCEGVRQAIVIDRERNGQPYLAAYVVPESDDWHDTVKEQISAKLPSYMVPATFTEISHVPLTLNGKLNRLALPEPTRWAASEHYAAPQNALQQQVCEIWQDVLGIDRIGVDDDFFHLGGNSIMAIKLIHRINQETGSALPLKSIYNHRTVRTLVEAGSSCVAHSIQPGKLLDPTLPLLPNNGKGRGDGLFITGATGFVGRYLLHELLMHSDNTIYCLLRGQDETVTRQRLKRCLMDNHLWHDHFEDRIKIVLGDIDKPMLGMNQTDKEHLADAVGTIYHCATYMNHLASYQEMKTANVDSVEEILKLASEKRPKRIVYLSTTGIFGTQPVRIVDETTEISNERHTSDNGYVATKWMAEDLVLQARQRGFDISVVRLGLVSGSQQTGRGDDKQWLTRLMRTVRAIGCSFKEPLIETSVLPVDYVARAIRVLSQVQKMDPVYHLSREEPLNFPDLVARYNTVSDDQITLVDYNEFVHLLLAHKESGNPIDAEYLFADDINALQTKGHVPEKVHAKKGTVISSRQTRRILDEFGLSTPKVHDETVLKYFMQ